jgi:hypothetical protein
MRGLLISGVGFQSRYSQPNPVGSPLRYQHLIKAMVIHLLGKDNSPREAAMAQSLRRDLEGCMLQNTIDSDSSLQRPSWPPQLGFGDFAQF